MRKLILAAVLLLGAAVPAVAQPEPTPGEMEAVREFLEVARMRENFIRTMEATMETGMASDALITPEVAETLRQFFAEHFRYEDMEPGFIRMYTDLFTEEELRALTAFYRTPAGQRFVELTPDIAVRTQTLTSELMEEAMPALFQLLMEQMELEEETEDDEEEEPGES